MKLGILNAIHPDTSTLDWGGSPIVAFTRFFQSVDAPFTYAGYEAAQGELPQTVDACDAYIITGSPSGAYEADEWIAALAYFIRQAYQAEKRMVGICFGHQILAQALGGRVEKSEKGLGFGLKQFDVSIQKGWMADNLAQCALYFSHQDQVVQLPPDAVVLGGNAFCPITLYEIENRVLGIQGHPELTAKMMDDITVLVEDEMEAEAYKTAVASLQNGRPDAQVVGHWIVDFLRM